MAKRNKKIAFNDLTRLIAEDQVGMSDKWATGISGRFHKPQAITLIDLLKKTDDPQHPNRARAPQGMPHNAQMMVELVGEAVLKIDEIATAIGFAKSNPVIEGNEKAHLRLDSIVNKVDRIKKIVESIGQDIDDFSIVNEEFPEERSSAAGRGLDAAPEKRRHERRVEKRKR
jgi:hypothetical protein